jgi:hypothetical protein
MEPMVRRSLSLRFTPCQPFSRAGTSTALRRLEPGYRPLKRPLSRSLILLLVTRCGSSAYRNVLRMASVSGEGLSPSTIDSMSRQRR